MQVFATYFMTGKSLSPVNLLIFFSLFLILLPTKAFSQTTLRLVIQPIQSEQRTREIFQPLADYIEFISAQKVELITYPNYISYWSETQKPDSYDISFDAAHFIDYRDKNHDFTVLAKQPGIISISLIVPEDSLVFDPEELIGKKIATPGPPSIAALRVDEFFDNPVRLPTVIEGTDSGHIMTMLLNGEVDAAMLPTPLVSAQMSGEGGISMVVTTDATPSMAISVSPNITAEIREKLTRGLIEAEKTPEGKKMLEGTRLNPFEKTSNQEYFGFSELLLEQ